MASNKSTKTSTQDSTKAETVLSAHHDVETLLHLFGTESRSLSARKTVSVVNATHVEIATPLAAAFFNDANAVEKARVREESKVIARDLAAEMIEFKDWAWEPIDGRDNYYAMHVKDIEWNNINPEPVHWCGFRDGNWCEVSVTTIVEEDENQLKTAAQSGSKSMKKGEEKLAAVIADSDDSDDSDIEGLKDVKDVKNAKNLKKSETQKNKWAHRAFWRALLAWKNEASMPVIDEKIPVAKVNKHGVAYKRSSWFRRNFANFGY